MTKQVSIADARNHFTALVHDVEQDAAIELTRRGKPVAMLISIQEYQRLARHQASFWEAFTAFQNQVHLKNLDIEPDLFAGLRDPSPGREVSW